MRGDSLRDIAGRFGTSRSALSRHRPHVATALVRAAERKGERLEETLLEKVGRLEADARRLGERAESEGDLRAALVAVDKLLDVSKLLHELMPVPGSDARTLAEQLARARAERLTINVVPLEQTMDGKISPHEALERLVAQGYLTQDVADEAMRRKRGEGEPPRKLLKGPAPEAS